MSFYRTGGAVGKVSTVEDAMAPAWEEELATVEVSKPGGATIDPLTGGCI